MHFCVTEIDNFRSPKLPKCVETHLRSLLQADDKTVTQEALNKVPKPEDSNLDVVEEILGVEVIVDGSVALQVTLDGLKQRLNTTVLPNERIILVGD
jgi:hypothetical protein